MNRSAIIYKVKVIVTGGCGFIGHHFVEHLIKNTDWEIINIDKLTYASDLSSLIEVEKNTRYHFHRVDICNRGLLNKIFIQHKPNYIMHLAAESHVDNSISGPKDFINTNITNKIEESYNIKFIP